MAQGEKLLAEWFWVDRWMGSSAFALPIDARGLYREMLSQAWRRQAKLPNDPDQIRRLTGVTLKEWRRTWPLVERFWRVEGDSLVNDTQLEVYGDAQGRAQAARNRGLRGAQARYEHKPQSLSLSPEKNISQTLFVPKRADCTYCGATPEQTHWALELDHFLPRSAGGSDDPSNLVWACHVCNQAKSRRVFATIDDCRTWLHRAYWSTNRKRWIAHRPFAFGGQPPDKPQAERWQCPHIERCGNSETCAVCTRMGRPERVKAS